MAKGRGKGGKKNGELNNESNWGPMLIFKGFDEIGFPSPCEEEDFGRKIESLNPLLGGLNPIQFRKKLSHRKTRR